MGAISEKVSPFPAGCWPNASVCVCIKISAWELILLSVNRTMPERVD